MEEDKSNFDEKIKRALESLPEATPSDAEFKALEKELVRAGVIKKGKRRFFFLIITAGAVFSFGLWFTLRELKNAPVLPAIRSENPAEASPESHVQKETDMSDSQLNFTVQSENGKSNSKFKSDPVKNPELKIAKSAIAGTEVKRDVISAPEPKNENKSLLVNKQPSEINKIAQDEQPVNSISQMVNDEDPSDKSVITGQDNLPFPVNSGTAEIPAQNPAGIPAVVTAGIEPDKTVQNTLNEDQLQDETVNTPPDTSIVIPDTAVIRSTDPVAGAPVETSAVVVINPEKVVSRWSVGVFSSWDKNTYRLKSENIKGDSLAVAESPLYGDKKFQSTIGLFAGYLITDNVEVSAGIRYSQKKTVFLQVGAVDSSDYGYGLNGEGYIFDFKGRYLQVPLRITYLRTINNLNIYGFAGVIPDFNLPVRNHDYFIRVVSDTGGTVTQKVTLEPTSIGLSAMAGAGIRVAVSRNIRFFLEPSWHYSFYPVIKHPTYREVPVNQYINTVSVGAGIIYSFSKAAIRPSLLSE
ncbi:MAG: PorT family protein [Bacteroidetes bacterium]|nr:PorT family protein [Bacteroidota bacterium]